MSIFRIRLLSVLAGALGLLGAAALVVPAQAAPLRAVPERKIAEGKITEAPGYRVELHRTGGFMGVDDYFVVYRQEPGNEELFAIVDGVEFQSLNSSYLPQNRCCDMFFYEVTARYADGTVKTIETMDSGHAPELLWRVIRLMM